MSDSAEDRERASIRFLEELLPEFGGILVGGYAVSAYGPARFSVDVDLVFPISQEAAVSHWLDEVKVQHSRTFGKSDAHPVLSKLRLSRGLLAGDFYFGGLRARGTSSVVDYEWIARTPRQVEL